MTKRATKRRTSPRTDVVTIRFQPELKYLAEIGARLQKRSLSSFIEWAVERALDSPDCQLSEGKYATTILEASRDIWDVDEADRFAKLALSAHYLLTFEEQKKWKIVQENTAFWDSYHSYQQSIENMRLKVLREYWEEINLAAEGDDDARLALEKLERQNKDVSDHIENSKEIDLFDDEEIPF